MIQPYRLLVLSSHPIQYQAPMHRALAAHPELDLTVLFCSEWGLTAYRDTGFGHDIEWDTPLLDGYRSTFLSNWSWHPALHRFWGVLNPGVVRWMLTQHYDAVLVYGWGRATNWLAMAAAAASRTPLLLRGESNLLNPVSPVKTLIKKITLRPLFAATAGFLSIGRYNTEFYRNWGVPSDKIFVTPYAVDNDFWVGQSASLAPRKSQLKCELGFDPNMPVVIFAGKLIAVKRPFDLLQAFDQVSKRVAAGMVFLGDGELRQELETYSRQRMLMNVRFVGFKNQTEMAPFFASADVFVLPSRCEPWGLVINEAMCFGLPVIASDKVGAAGDLVQPGVNGFVYPAGNVDALSEHLEELLLNSSLRHAAGQASRDLIQNWGISQSVDGVVKCLRCVVGEQSDLCGMAPSQSG